MDGPGWANGLGCSTHWWELEWVQSNWARPQHPLVSARTGGWPCWAGPQYLFVLMRFVAGNWPGKATWGILLATAPAREHKSQGWGQGMPGWAAAPTGMHVGLIQQGEGRSWPSSQHKLAWMRPRTGAGHARLDHNSYQFTWRLQLQGDQAELGCCTTGEKCTWALLGWARLQHLL